MYEVYSKTGDIVLCMRYKTGYIVVCMRYKTGTLFCV